MNWLDKLKDYAPSIAAAVFSGGATLPQLAAKMISDATGVNVTTVEDAEKAINAATPEQLLAIRLADNEFTIKMKSLESEMLGIINTTIQKEVNSGDAFVRRWRPFFGYCVALSWIVQMTGITFIFCYIAIAEPTQLVGLVAQLALLAGALSALWGLALAVLGLSVHQRSKDKCNTNKAELKLTAETNLVKSIKAKVGL